MKYKKILIVCSIFLCISQKSYSADTNSKLAQEVVSDPIITKLEEIEDQISALSSVSNAMYLRLNELFANVSNLSDDMKPFTKLIAPEQKINVGELQSITQQEVASEVAPTAPVSSEEQPVNQVSENIVPNNNETLSQENLSTPVATDQTQSVQAVPAQQSATTINTGPALTIIPAQTEQVAYQTPTYTPDSTQTPAQQAQPEAAPVNTDQQVYMTDEEYEQYLQSLSPEEFELYKQQFGDPYQPVQDDGQQVVAQQ